MKYVSTFFGAFILAAMLATLSVPVHAQPVPAAPNSEEDHSAHHPDGAQTETPAPAPAPTSPSQPGSMMDMMSMMRGGGMMEMMPMMCGGGMMDMMSMMRGGGMMEMMPMMRGGGMMEMMPMMRGGGMMGMMPMMRGGGMMGGMPFEHVEGRLAFLKTELKITPAQEPQWTKFAAAVRSVAQSTKPMHEQMMQGRQMMQGTESAVARLDGYERMLSVRLEAVRTVKGAFGPLYASLSDEQKKVADKLVASPMGVL